MDGMARVTAVPSNVTRAEPKIRPASERDTTVWTFHDRCRPYPLIELELMHASAAADLASFRQINGGMNVGAELREARQRAGLSREDVSQRTKIQLAKIDALEANAFERLPEGIYLHGLIRAYATEVGLDGSEVVARFQRHNEAALENGLEREEDYGRGDEPDRMAIAPVAVPAMGHQQRPSVVDTYETEYVDQDSTDYIVPPLASATHTASEMYPATSTEPADAISYSTIRPDESVSTAPPQRRGAGRFLLPALALLAAIGLGAYLYGRNQPFVEREDIATPAISHENSAEAEHAARVAAARQERPVATDAVPADRPASTEHHTEPVVEEPKVTPAPPRSAPANAVVPSRDTAAAAPGSSARGSEPATPGPAPATATPPTALESRSAAAEATKSEIAKPGGTDTTGRAASTAPAADLTGQWTLATRVETSNIRTYEGLQLGYRIELQQSGNRVTGEGVKTHENGRDLEGRGQTPIRVEGTLDGARLTLVFREQGTRRESDGKMILDIHEDGVLRGRFASSAARSTGTAEARRPEG